MNRLVVVARAALVAGAVLGAAGCGSKRAPAGENTSTALGPSGPTTVAAPTFGLGPITADELSANGVYLGPPGVAPVGVPTSAAEPPSTAVQGPVSIPPTTGVNPVRLAVSGDPANGKATVDAATATAVAMKNLNGFIGTPQVGPATLVQLVDVYNKITATVWAFWVRGRMELDLSAGPSLAGSTVPPATTSVVPARGALFVDAATGQFLYQLGFSA